MRTVIVCVGGQASGKSTYAKELLRKEPGKWKRINRDSLRLMLDNGEWSLENEKLIVKTRDYLLKEALRNGYDVILDDMNLSPKAWNDFCDTTKNLGIDVQIIEKHFWVPLEEAIERDAKRENSVGEKVVRDTWTKNKLQYCQHYKVRKEIFLANTKR
jgi:predicted kinase